MAESVFARGMGIDAHASSSSASPLSQGPDLDMIIKNCNVDIHLRLGLKAISEGANQGIFIFHEEPRSATAIFHNGPYFLAVDMFASGRLTMLVDYQGQNSQLLPGDLSDKYVLSLKSKSRTIKAPFENGTRIAIIENYSDRKTLNIQGKDSDVLDYTAGIEPLKK